MYKNIMLKISGESLAGDNEQGFDFDILNDLSKNIKIQLNRLEVGRSYKIDIVDSINQASEVRLVPSTQNITANSSDQNIAVRLDFSGSISLMNLNIAVTDNISGLVDHNTILVYTNNFQECY